MNSVVYILTVLYIVHILFIKETRTEDHTLQKLKIFHGFGLQGQVIIITFSSIKINFKKMLKEGTKAVQQACMISS